MIENDCFNSTVFKKKKSILPPLNMKMQRFYSVSFSEHFTSEELRSLDGDSWLQNLHLSSTWAQFSWLNSQSVNGKILQTALVAL